MRELLKYASTKSGVVSADVTTTTTGTCNMEKLCVDSLAIRD